MRDDFYDATPICIRDLILERKADFKCACPRCTGKKKPGSTTYGNKCLKAILTEFAWVASRMKDTYLRSKYHSLVGRRGKKRALVALGHKILIMCYHILKYKRPYKELGGDYLDKRRKDRITRSYIQGLNHLGYEVILQEAA